MQKIAELLRTPHIKILICASLAINILALALPVMTMQVYDRILTNNAIDTLVVISTGVIIAAAFEFCLRLARTKLLGYVGAHFEHEASVKAVENLLGTDPRNYERKSKIVLLQDVGSASRLKDYYGGQVAATMLVDIPFAVLLLGLTFYLSWQIALVCSVILAVFGYLSWKQGIKLKANMDEREEEDNKRYNFIIQILHSIHTVKALCLEAIMSRRFEEVQRNNGLINYRMASIQGSVSTLGYATAQFMTIAVICVATPIVVTGHITVGVLVACVMLSGQVMQPIQRGLGLWIRMQDINIAKERLGGLLEMPQRDVHSAEEMGQNHGAIKLDKVRFSYVEGQPVLDNASIDIEPGEVVAIHGASGSGKTTLLELMAGIYQPDKGSITLSGMEPWKLDQSERARYIAYLPSKGMILRGSIMDNLCGFDPKRQPEVKKIIELLGIEEVVARLPAGYDTPLEGLTTDVIAPGLKQRLAIARALLFKPRLILYDNADQGLDRESYARVFGLLAKLKGKATLVIASEDKNILSLADKSIEVRRGRLVQMTEQSPIVAGFKKGGF